ncbi:circadian clock protein KaiC [Rhodoblastus sphagnicola]|uniref:circadian clock protein KaiC n=1 Tax=Rhodoblastus sphagnicola TaxID=333368 RepID=UPI001304B446|nr:circadian clock protein KaiC [Rhodoblastus sphagnicola]MBB4197903.1 circadian clock protein KaiC [Rhodoblastus sphagnicola]
MRAFLLNAQAQTLAKTSSGKTPSGIAGFDDITGGGLPTGRCSLLRGGAGSGKTLFGLTFLAEGALKYRDPGVFICFEETEAELSANFASLGYDLEQLKAANRLAVVHIRVARGEIIEVGGQDFGGQDVGGQDLDGLFLRIGQAIRAVGAKRVVLDPIESLIAGFADMANPRADLRRLFGWLKDRGVTALITGEGGPTGRGFEDHLSDCVIQLDHRVVERVATRTVRVVKYRGAAHGADEYPFLIDAHGIFVPPVGPSPLARDVSTERVRTGIAALDDMLGGEGFWRGSSILVSGVAGAGKTTLAARFAEAACQRGEKVVFFACEASPPQIVRDMGSVGIALQRWIDAGQLRFVATRQVFPGVETHLPRMYREVERFSPGVVVIDSLSTLAASDARAMLPGLIDALKGRGITALLTAAETDAPDALDRAAVYALMDAWLQARMIESGGARARGLVILKARGLAHSSQIRAFTLSAEGVKLGAGPMPGSIPAPIPGPSLARAAALNGAAPAGVTRQEPSPEVSAAEAARRHEAEAKKRMIEIRRRELGARIASLQTKLAQSEREADMLFARQQGAEEAAAQFRREAARPRGRT